MKALVTGAASGIGLAVANSLSKHDLVLTDRAKEALEAATIGLPSAAKLAGDVGDEAFWKTAAPHLAELDFAIVNAGVSGSGPIDEMEYREWRRILSVNLDGVFLTLKASIAAMKAHGRGGAIVVVASASGLKAEPGVGAYGASKAGALHLMRIAAKEAAPHGIRINAIAPAGVKTPIWRDVPVFTDLVYQHGNEEAAFAAMAGMATPLGRFASAVEIARQILFLLSDDAATITGATLTSDGGYLL